MGFLNRTSTYVAMFKNLTVFISQSPSTYHAFYSQCDFKRNGWMHKAAVSTHLQVVIGSLCSTFSDFQIAFWKAIKKITIFVSCAVLFKDVPHFGFKKGHIHINGHHLWIKTSHQMWHSTACGTRLSKPSLRLAFGNAVLRACASGELGSQWKDFILLNWAALVL